MIATATTAPDDTPAAAQFPDFRFPYFPPFDDMMNVRHLHDYGLQPALRLFLGHPDTTIVMGEVPLAWDFPPGPVTVPIPGLLVAFNVRTDQILDQMGYAIDQQGKAPDFVLEVASDNAPLGDATGNRLDYADFGVTEYWLFDPDWGQRCEQGLMGWTLVSGAYEPIPVREYAADQRYGYSAALGLYVCWEHGRLRWYDAATGYLRTHDEEQSGRLSAETENQRLRDEIARLRAANGP